MNIKFDIVNELNLHAVLNLRVKETQSNFIETTKECLDEAKQLPLWRPTAIYVDNTLVGFAMYGLWKYEGAYGRVWLDRFLIDDRYQGNGYSMPILIELINKIVNEYKCEEIYLSLYDDNKLARSIYEKLGFVFNGEIDIKGEKVMVLKVEIDKAE